MPDQTFINRGGPDRCVEHIKRLSECLKKTSGNSDDCINYRKDLLVCFESKPTTYKIETILHIL